MFFRIMRIRLGYKPNKGAKRKPNIESTIKETRTIQIPRITLFDFIVV